MPVDGNDVPRIAVDLTNREETVAALSGLSDVTHIFYEARFDHPEGEGGSIETNAAMFRNLIDATVPRAWHQAIATVWMATELACANQDFNITNGDLFRWKKLFPKFARYFALEPGPVETVDLSDYMSDKEPLWRRVIEKYGLFEQSLDQVTLWGYWRHLWTPDWDIVSSMTKAR